MELKAKNISKKSLSYQKQFPYLCLLEIPVVPKEEWRKIEHLAQAGIVAHCKQMANYK